MKKAKTINRLIQNISPQKSWLWALLLLIIGCKVSYQTQDFASTKAPNAPNYDQENNWAVLPWAYPEVLQALSPRSPDSLAADVFYVYPTLLLDAKDIRWNSPVTDLTERKKVIDLAVRFQASAWATAGKLYVPYYRQAHIRAYEQLTAGGRQALELAYSDVKRAFVNYLRNHNQGRPIIIASHSQGTTHTIRLLKEFFDGKPLQRQLVAAYLPGIGVQPATFKHLRPMDQPAATGGFVSWNTYRQYTRPKKGDNWYVGAVTTNPITWDGAVSTQRQQHKGFLYSNGKLYRQALKISLTDGLVWTSLPHFPHRYLALFNKSYHRGDINLFWQDIRHNAELRVQRWLEERQW